MSVNYQQNLKHFLNFKKVMGINNKNFYSNVLKEDRFMYLCFIGL